MPGLNTIDCRGLSDEQNFQEKFILIAPEIDRLLELAWQKQSHVGDLLLIHLNGFYNEDIIGYDQFSDKKYNPHVFGPGNEGLSEHLHYTFIHKYRTTNIAEFTYTKYLEKLKWTKEKRELIKELKEKEEETIQLEMLIYLKFWEADLIIKKFYQFARILNSEPYDWYFKIAESSRDKNCTGTRQELIRVKIRDKLKTISPVLYAILEEAYKTQIRNSIAHSNYSFSNRMIGLNNFIKQDPHSQLKGISFNQWTDLFHSTIVLHNEYVRMGTIINDHYAKVANQNGNVMEILVTEKGGKQYPMFLECGPIWKDWRYKQQ